MVKILKDVYDKMLDFFLNSTCETGGILGEKEGIIVSFFGDKNGKCSNDTYEPEVSKLNNVINEWYLNDIDFSGLIHSHVGGCPKLSNTDKEYAKEILKVMSFNKLLFPLAVREQNSVKIYLYVLENETWILDKFEFVN